MDRRDFLRWMGVATGASVLAGCDLTRKSEKLIPYLVPPEDGLIPGEASFVATTCNECPARCGATARVRDARPVKLEGAAGHPINDGALCIRGQASLNRLYHVDRIRQPLMQDGAGNLVPGTWNQAFARIVDALKTTPGQHALLSGHTTGSLAVLMDEFATRMAVDRLPEFELISGAAVREANRSLFGEAVMPAVYPDRADVIVTVGADVLETHGNPVAFSTALARRRESGAHVNWFHVEPHATMTGFQATHRLAARPGSEAHVLAFLLHSLAGSRALDARASAHVSAVPVVTADRAAEVSGIAADALQKMASALTGARTPLVLAAGVSVGTDAGLDVARIAALIQWIGGMNGSTLDLARGADVSRLGSLTDMERLTQRLTGSQIGVMFLFGVDPVARLEDGTRFGDALGKAGFLVGVGDMHNPTLALCDVVLPLSHALEAWGDAEPAAGVVSVIQPAMTPLFDTLSDGDILLRIMSEAGASAPITYQQYVMDRWARDYGTAADQMVKTGYIQTPVAARSWSLRDPDHRYSFDTTGAMNGPVLVVAPSVRWYDGRSAALELMKEIPDPLTSVSWDAWVSVGLETAAALGVTDQDEIELKTGDWSTRLPVRRQPGLGRDVFMVHRGAAPVPAAWSRTSGEAGAMFGDITVTPTGRKVRTTILSGSLFGEGRAPVPGEKPAHFGALGAITQAGGHGAAGGDHGGESHGEGGHGGGHALQREDLTFYPVPTYPNYRWAMAIDMDKCTGCSACVAACTIENNVAMSGREQHLKGREMQWIRIEQTYAEDGSRGDFVPTMCQHCDFAPCEPVCPVYATYHNDEGLNAQVYNRCVGTRYCGNNCSYKQRRFNWFSWENRPHPMNLMTNPDVSMRGKGIMEKCTFCVQKIRKARDVAKDENRKIMDGEIVPACAQSCPGKAIVFGNLLDENTEVYKWAHSERATRLLEELGTSPGVYYLKKGNGHDA